MRGGTHGTEGQLFHRVSSAGCAGQERGIEGGSSTARVSRPGWDLLPESRLDARRGILWGLSFFLFSLPPAGEPNQNCHSGPVSQKGSDYTIPETDAGAARAGSGQGQRHRRACTLAVAHTRRPDLPSLRAPRAPAPHNVDDPRPLRPSPQLAVARAARASQSWEPLARVPDAGLWEVRGLDSRRLPQVRPARSSLFRGLGTGQLVPAAAPAFPGREGVPNEGNKRK